MEKNGEEKDIKKEDPTEDMAKAELLLITAIAGALIGAGIAIYLILSFHLDLSIVLAVGLILLGIILYAIYKR